jgi:hypothetical protein
MAENEERQEGAELTLMILLKAIVMRSAAGMNHPLSNPAGVTRFQSA